MGNVKSNIRSNIKSNISDKCKSCIYYSDDKEIADSCDYNSFECTSYCSTVDIDIQDIECNEDSEQFNKYCEDNRMIFMGNWWKYEYAENKDNY